MDKVYRIYTEDVARERVVEAIAAKFDNFTLQPTTGFYKGKPEQSIVVEIVDAEESDIDQLAKQIRAIAGEKSVLVVILTGRAKRIEIQ